MEEIIDISGNKITSLDSSIINKLNIFLHPGRSELLLSDNVILVEGYTEELLLRDYLNKNNRNWTIVNVAGVMFEPYIKLAILLGKKVLVISDNDISLSKNKEKSSRFLNLTELCQNNSIKLVEIDNTLETDLYNNGYLSEHMSLLKKHDNHEDIYIAKDNKKIEIAEALIEKKTDLSEWHAIKEIEKDASISDND